MTQPPLAAHVSVFQGSTNTTPVERVPLVDVLHRIQTGTYQQNVERLRHLLATEGKARYDAAKKHNVAAGPYGHVNVGYGAGARESRVYVNNCRAAPLGFHHPLKSDGMALGHVRALDYDAVRVLQILLERSCAAPSERDPQTGDR